MRDLLLPIEVCIQCDTREHINVDARAAFDGGAARIELCSEMQYDGLTPDVILIREARKIFKKNGLMVMIRPRQGHFIYSREEVQLMIQQIHCAATAGADGVVIGALRANDNRLDCRTLGKLVEISKTYGLGVTLHRAFDATPDPFEALEQLIALNVDRVLTSGTAWSTGQGALAGVERLCQLIKLAAARIEVVIGGGISADNVAAILAGIPACDSKRSLHAYSGVHDKGRVQINQVKALVEATTIIEEKK